MNNVDTISELYATMAYDMKINKFNFENDECFHYRIIYSGIANWILQLFSDVFYELSAEDEQSVSKTHVTLSACELLSSFVKLDKSLESYFGDAEKIKKFIIDIERIYVSMGYVNSGHYLFKSSKRKQFIDLHNEKLIIDADANYSKFYGLGIIGPNSEDSISIEDFSLIKNNSLEYFKRMTSKLKFSDFSMEYGNIEIYNIDKNRWEQFTNSVAQKYEYGILKIDEGLDYKILKFVEGKFYTSSLPEIYSNGMVDDFFKHEIWRIILGMCAYNNKPVKARISNYCGNSKISFRGFILPWQEYSILKCLSWPQKNSMDNNYIVVETVVPSIIEMLGKLSITVIDERVK